jgi:hypothetical protein
MVHRSRHSSQVHAGPDLLHKQALDMRVAAASRAAPPGKPSMPATCKPIPYEGLQEHVRVVGDGRLVGEAVRFKG